MVVAQVIDYIDTQASLGVFGTGVDFQLISQELRTQPSHSHRAGDPGLTSRPYPQDLWLLESPLLPSDTLDAHLKWLGDLVAPHYQFLRMLKQKHEIRSYCGISIRGSGCRFRISPEALNIFVDLGIAMNLTVVFTGESQSELDVSAEGRAEPAGAVASFEIVGKPSDVGEVASELNTLAPYVSRAAESETSAKVQQSSFWVVTAPEVGDGLDAQLIWLASELSPYSSFLQSVARRVAPLVRCALRAEKDISDQSLSPEGLSFLTSVGIPMELDASLVA